MKLKPPVPVLELVIPPLLTYFSIKTILVGQEKANIATILAGILFLVMGIVALFWINRKFSTIELEGTLIIKGLFWGKHEFDLSEIRTYKLLETRRTKYGVRDQNLIMFNADSVKMLEITRGDYKSADWDSFLATLNAGNITPT